MANPIRSKITQALAFIKSSRKALIITASVLIIFVSSAVLYSLNRSGILKLSSDISKISQIVSAESVSSYIEIASPSAFYAEFKKSKPGSQILSTPVWKRFFAGSSFAKLNQIIYLIDSSTGQMLSLEELVAFADGPVGYAKYEDGSFLAIAQLDLKSEIGVKLLSFFSDAKESKLKDIPAKEPNNNENKPVTDSSYKESFGNSPVDIENIKVNEFKNEKYSMYYLISGKYIIISDSKVTLGKSISCAKGDVEESIYGMGGFSKTLKNYGKTDLLFFQHFNNSPYGESLKALFGSESVSAVFKLYGEKPYADLFFPGAQAAAVPAQSPDWSKILPKENSISILSSKSVTDVVNSDRKSVV